MQKVALKSQRKDKYDKKPITVDRRRSHHTKDQKSKNLGKYLDEKWHLIGWILNDKSHPSIYFLKEAFIRKLPRIQIFKEWIFTYKNTIRCYENYVVS